MSGELLELKNIKKNFGDRCIKRHYPVDSKGEFHFFGCLDVGNHHPQNYCRTGSPGRGTGAFGGKDVTDLPPNRRDINTVFQNYALSPHMNVEANIGYGLRIKNDRKRKFGTE